MPRGDGTGPTGMGPRTGRGMGYCSGYSTPGTMNPGSRGPVGLGGLMGIGRWSAGFLPRVGRGLGLGRGGGGGRNRWF